MAEHEDLPPRMGWLVVPWTCAVFAILVGGSALLLMPGGSNSVRRDPHRTAIAIAGLAGAVAFVWTLVALGAGRGRFGGRIAALLMISLLGALFLFLSSAIA